MKIYQGDQSKSILSRYQSIYTAKLIGIIICDKAGRMIEANERSYEMGVDNIFIPTFSSWVEIVLATGRSICKKLLHLESTHSFKEYWIEADLQPVFAEDGQTVEEVIIVFYDITMSKMMKDELKLITKAFDKTVEAIFVVDHHYMIQSVNPAFTQITGYDPVEVTGKSIKVLSPKEYDHEFYDHEKKILEKNGQWTGEKWIISKNGTSHPVWASISTVKNPQNDIEQYVIVFSDITEQKKQQQQIEFHTYYDLLTHLPNRILFHDTLKRSLRKANQQNQKLGLVFLDLDRFKYINDTLGHAIGDVLLQKVAGLLIGCAQEKELLFRLGGDEFMMIVQDILDEEQLEKTAQEILELFERPFRIHGQELYITASIGISIYPIHGTETETIVKNADVAMYKAKERGRNNYQIYREEMGAKNLERLTMENHLRRALMQKQFILYYQPKIELNTGKLKGVEALLRWNNPVLGMVSPMEFIPLAEEVGLIIPIGEWVIRTACKQMKEWQDAGLPPISVAVNLSAKQLENRELVEVISDILQETGLNPKYLELEITETIGMENFETTIFIIKELKSMGIQVHLDDFGTGYSSLNYLKKLDVDVVKIDRSFMKELPDNAEDGAIVRTIIAMAHTLNLKVLAEGIENDEQLVYVKQNGCDQVQGFYFSPPLQMEDLKIWFLRKQ